MTRARLYAAAVAFLLALLLARVAFAPSAAPSATLAIPAPAAAPLDPHAPAEPLVSASADPAVEDPFAASYDGPSPPATASPPTVAPSTAAAADAPPSLAQVRDTLARLDAARAAAYAAPDDGDPDAWATRTCACHRDDAERLRALARDGLALRGHGVTVESIAFAAPPTATRVVLVVTDRVAAYAAVDAAGRTVSRWPASGPRRWRVTLAAVSGRWLVGELARAP